MVQFWPSVLFKLVSNCVCPPQASKVWIQNKMDESKHEIHSQVDAITAGTASVVNLTAGQWHWHIPANHVVLYTLSPPLKICHQLDLASVGIWQTGTFRGGIFCTVL